MNDRIKLAEAMGWQSTSSYTSPDGVKESYRWRTPSGVMGQQLADLPDPENDANDDYAVLEWANVLIFSKRMKFSRALGEILQRINENPQPNDVSLRVAWPDAAIRYKVGDYARATLQVIDSPTTEGVDGE